MVRPRCAIGYPQCQAPGTVIVGRVSTDGADPRAGLLPITAVPATWGQDSRPRALDAIRDCTDREEYLWLLSSQVSESYSAGEAPVPYPPVPSANDETVSGRSVMHLRVKASTAAGARPFLVDLGQSIEFYAQGLNVELVAPLGSVSFTPSLGQAAALPAPAIGVLFTSFVGVRIEKIEASRSVASALFTQTVYVPAEQTTNLQIPTAAQRLTAYAETATTPVMRWVRGGVIDLGRVDWDPLRPRLEIDVPSANTLRIVSAAAARLFTLVWTIAP